MSLGTTVHTKTENVRFFIPSWDEAVTAQHAETLRQMGQYAKAAGQGHGLSDDEVTDDLNARYGHLGAVSVSRDATAYGVIFWIEITP